MIERKKKTRSFINGNQKLAPAFKPRNRINRKHAYLTHRAADEQTLRHDIKLALSARSSYV